MDWGEKVSELRAPGWVVDYKAFIKGLPDLVLESRSIQLTALRTTYINTSSIFTIARIVQCPGHVGDSTIVPLPRGFSIRAAWG